MTITTRWSLNNTTGGLWATNGNWSAGAPVTYGDTAAFDITDAALSGGGAGTRTIDLGGAARQVGTINLVGDIARNWNIANGTLDLGGIEGVSTINFTGTQAAASARISATIDPDLLTKITVSGPVAYGNELRLGNIAQSLSAGSQIEKLGNGILVLTGTNATTGTTTISGGKLQVGDQTASGALGSGDVINNATLVFARTDAVTVANNITGTGDIAFAGNGGSVTLTGSNTNNFFVSVQNNATLKMGNVHALDGTSVIDVQAGSTLDFNGVQVTGSFLDNSFFNRIIGSTGTITNSGAQTYLYSFSNAAQSFGGSLKGNLIFAKLDANTLTLTGANFGDGSNSLAAILDGKIALSGANASLNTRVTFQSSTAHFDISGITGSSTAVQQIYADTGVTGHVELGGKTLVVANGDATTGNNVDFIGTNGVRDTLQINLNPAATSLNLSAARSFTNWESGDEIVVFGNSLSNTITGTDNRDVFFGGGGNDILSGLGGNDEFWDNGSKTSNDRYDGGLGSDLVSYQFAAAGVKVNLALATAQVTGGAGTDTLLNIENLLGSGFADTLTGNGDANFLAGFNGNDKLIGGGGADRLFGGAGNDTLDGGTGIDYMDGETGNDIYVVDDSADVVTESTAGTAGGTDLVNASASFTLGANIENLTLTGTGDINGTGNDLANKLTGNTGNNTLIGGGGNDTIDGKAGADAMFGGDGNDTYIVDNLGDTVTETTAATQGGTDTVKSSVHFTLGANIENLTLTGTTGGLNTGDMYALGNSLNNVLIANNSGNSLYGLGGNDTLKGGAFEDYLFGNAGKDTLTGGGGLDRFYFDVLETSANRDTVTDFSSAQGDQLVLDHFAFTALTLTQSGNPILGAEFTLGKFATTTSQHVIYDQPTGSLYYDNDGSGANAQVLVAILSNHAVISAADVHVL